MAARALAHISPDEIDYAIKTSQLKYELDVQCLVVDAARKAQRKEKARGAKERKILQDTIADKDEVIMRLQKQLKARQ